MPHDVLQLIAENIERDDGKGGSEWLTNGKVYSAPAATVDGKKLSAEETSKRAAATDSRIYRRDVARFLNIPEREVRTRIWPVEVDDGKPAFAFGLLLRASENGNAAAADSD